MNTYIIFDETRNVMALNQSLMGCAMELYGMSCQLIGGRKANLDELTESLSKSAKIDAETENGQKITIERHYLSN